MNMTKCPYCKSNTKVYDCRIEKDGRKVRRRECLICKARFRTVEVFDRIMEQPIKEVANGKEAH